MIVYEKPAEYRGTIEVYVEDVLDFNEAGVDAVIPEWRWRCKSRNGQILASGEGYKRRAIHDRHGNTETIGAVY